MGVSSYLLNSKKYKNLSIIVFVSYINIEPFTGYVRMSLENKVQYPVPVLCQTFNNLFTKVLSNCLDYPNKTSAKILESFSIPFGIKPYIKK